MAGQGVVAETMNLAAGRRATTTGGTVHIVVNNQIGFTTNPERRAILDVLHRRRAGFRRSRCSTSTPTTRRRAFARRRSHSITASASIRTSVIDMVCYRKYGHNEADDPSYTQPILYRKIRAQKPVADQYAERLANDGLISADEAKNFREIQRKKLYEIYDQAQKNKEQYELQELSAIPAEVDSSGSARRSRGTRDAGTHRRPHHRIPGGFPRASQADRVPSQSAAKRFKPTGAQIDWALAEVLAFGTPGAGRNAGAAERRRQRPRHVQPAARRISRRGKRSRVCSAGSIWRPTRRRSRCTTARCREFAVMGFEFGYSVADPTALVLWEGAVRRFRQRRAGDYRSVPGVGRIEMGTAERSGSAASAWAGRPGSGAFERAPGAVSAALRRKQYARGELHHARPVFPSCCAARCAAARIGAGCASRLIVMTPKSLLRHPKVVSTADELTGGAFHPLLDDTSIADPTARSQDSGVQRKDLLRARRRAR